LLTILLAVAASLLVGVCWAADTATFQQGADGYAGCMDTWIQSGQGDKSGDGVIYADNNSDGSVSQQALIRFQQVFVSEGGPVPDGSVIESATLSVRAIEKSGSGGMLGRMLQSWNATDTWSTAGSPTENGVQSAAIEYEGNAGAGDPRSGYTMEAVYQPASQDTTYNLDVTASVQQWSDGAPNYGWVIHSYGQSSHRLASANNGTAANRPMLAITYSAADALRITAFSVQDSATSSSTLTMTGALDVTLGAFVPEGVTLVGFQITETPDEPTDGTWEAAITSYTIQGGFGSVTLYAWAKDDLGNVVKRTATIAYSNFSATLIGTDVDFREMTIQGTWVGNVAEQGYDLIFWGGNLDTAGNRSYPSYAGRAAISRSSGGTWQWARGPNIGNAGVQNAAKTDRSASASYTDGSGTQYVRIPVLQDCEFVLGLYMLSWDADTDIMVRVCHQAQEGDGTLPFASAGNARSGSWRFWKIRAIAGDTISVFCKPGAFGRTFVSMLSFDEPLDTRIAAFMLTSRNPAGSTALTLSSTVDVLIDAKTYNDDTVVGYMITETSDQPASDDAGWNANEPTEYTFTPPEGGKGTVTLYAWVKDSKGKIVGKSSSIFYAVDDTPVTISNVRWAVRAGTATIAWDSDPASDGYILYGVSGEALSNVFLVPTVAASQNVAVSGLAGSTYEMEIHCGTGVEYLTVYMPRVDGNNQYSFYWDGAEAEYNADFDPANFSNHWRSAYTSFDGSSPLNGGSGSTLAALPGNERRSVYVNQGKASFTDLTQSYLFSWGRTDPVSPSPAYVFASDVFVSGTGEMIWNNGHYRGIMGVRATTGGTLTINGGTMYHVGGWNSRFSAQTGTINLNDGDVYAAVYLSEGSAYANSVFNQTGGMVRGVIINHGTANQSGGTVDARTTGNNDQLGDLIIGRHQHWYNTTAYYNLGDDEGNTGTITGTGKVIVGGNDNFAPSNSGPGVMEAFFRGYGVITVATFDNNRAVIADGYGVERTLDLSAVPTVTNTYDNAAQPGGFGAGRFGWFAENMGKLVLPPAFLDAGTSTVNWGESATDTSLDLLNSMTISGDNVDGGDLAIALLATDRSEANDVDPSNVIGLWDIDGSGFEFGAGSVSITIRYDNYLATTLGLAEEDLKVYHKVGGSWVDVTAAVDTTAKLITTTPLTSLSLIAISTDLGAPGTTVTSFVVTDATSGSTLVTNEATVNVAIAAVPGTGAIAGYIVNESATQPAADDPAWAATAPATYAIAGGEGTVTIYGWAKDEAGSIGGASVEILFSTAAPVVSNVVVTDNGNDTATATWTTDIAAQGGLKYGPVAMSGATPNAVVENAVGTSHSATFAITAGVNYKIILVNNEVASPAFYWPGKWSIPGDVNGDCRVNILDLIAIRNKLNLDVSTGDNWIADVNEDGRINILDLIAVRNKLNTQCP